KDDFGPVGLGLPQDGGQVGPGGGDIGGPQQDQVTVLHIPGGQVAGAPHDLLPASGLGGAAQGALEAAGAQGVEGALSAVAVDHAHGAGVGVGQNGLRSVLGDQVLQAGCDLSDGPIPGDGLKLPGPLGAGAAEGSEDTLRA